MSNQTTERVFHQAVIPTISLFQIEELVGDKLDGYIHYLKARSATESAIPQDEMPYKWITLKTYQTPIMLINYNHSTMQDAQFTLPLAIEIARRYNVWECWIDRLDFYIVHKQYGHTVYQFKNKPITKGSNAETFVYNFYRKRQMLNQIKKIPRRHLELVDTRVTDKKRVHLDSRITHSNKFIAWLNRTLESIVFNKTVKRTLNNLFVDLDISSI